MDELAGGQLNRDKVIRGFSRLAVRRGVIFNTQLFGINQDTKVAVSLVIVVFKNHRVVPIREGGLRRRRSERKGAFMCETRDRVPAVAGDDKGRLAAVFRPCEPLIIVRVS